MKFLDLVNSIVDEYRDQGYTLTLRQLYYQLVSRDIIPNQQREYKKLSRILNEGRMAGYVDWSAIEDRLRNAKRVTTWDSPSEVLNAAADQFKYDRLQGQPKYIEVWVEKDALSQVIERSASRYQVTTMVQRGYGSASAMYAAYHRFAAAALREQECVLLYLGDHDPSGLDMIRDIRDRLELMLSADNCEEYLTVEHLALTQEQIQQYNPPPNPTKVTDSRAGEYIAQYGHTSWEVDALEPSVLDDLITDHILRHIDLDMYQEWEEKEIEQREKMFELIKNFE